MNEKEDLFEPSDEQKIILNELENNNVVVEAVAGAGKTTTSLHIAKKFKNLNILLLTYNAKLKIETRKKIESLELDNIEVHTFHSFAYKYYDEKQAITDAGIRKIVDNVEIPEVKFYFDIIIIDEAQDLTPLYYEYLCNVLINNNNQEFKLCILGDPNQAIYQYNKADHRYISLADKLFKFNSLYWSKCSLSNTFRVAKQTTKFINECFYNKNVIFSNKTADIPLYYVTDTYDNYAFYDELIKIFKNYNYEDIFILAPSLRSIKTAVIHFSNYLSDKGIAIFVPSSDEEKLVEQLLEGKIVFSTFHQSKGLERKLVVIFNFDNSYFNFYAKDLNPEIPSNPLYVAVTRALEKVILVHHYTNDFLPFLNKNALLNCVDLQYRLSPSEQERFYHEHFLRNSDIKDNNEIKQYPVTNIIRHTTESVYNYCSNYYSKKKVFNQETNLDIATTISNNNLLESVADINGIAIPLAFDYVQDNDLVNTHLFKTILFLLDQDIEEFKMLKKYQDFIMYLKGKNDLTLDELLKLSNIWLSVNNGLNFKLNQINEDNYTWMNADQLNQAIEIMEQHVSKDSIFEIRISIGHQEKLGELYNKQIAGYIDCIDEKNKTVWEFKCVEEIKEDHFLQLLIYAYMLYFNQENYVNCLNKQWKPEKISQEKIYLKACDFAKVGSIAQFSFKNKTYEAKIIKFGLLRNSFYVKIEDHNNLIRIKKRNYLKGYDLKTIKEKNIITKDHQFCLFNILNNEIYELNFNIKDLPKMIDKIMWSKFFDRTVVSDNEFLTQNLQIYSKYNNLRKNSNTTTLSSLKKIKTTILHKEVEIIETTKRKKTKVKFEDDKHFSNRLMVKFDPNTMTMNSNSYVVLDFETANHKRTSACQIAIALVKNGKLVEKYVSLIKPYPLEFVDFFIKIHHIDYESVKDAKTFNEIWDDIKHFFDYEVVLAHNAAFDMSVLKALVNHYKIDCPNFTHMVALENY